MARDRTWLTTREAATALGLSVHTVRHIVKSGVLQGRFIRPRMYAIEQDAIDEYRRTHLGHKGWTARKARQEL